MNNLTNGKRSIPLNGVTTGMAGKLNLGPVQPRSQGSLRKEERGPGKGRCLLLLLRIRSTHLEILGFPMGGAY